MKCPHHRKQMFFFWLTSLLKKPLELNPMTPREEGIEKKNPKLKEKIKITGKTVSEIVSAKLLVVSTKK